MEFLNSNHTHTALVGGYGSGKTHIGVIKAIKKNIELNSDIAYYLPSYSLIKDVAIRKFQEMLTQWNVNYSLHQTHKIFTTDYGDIILRSFDRHDLIIGYEVGYSIIDEADVLPTSKMHEVYVKCVSRNRAKVNEANKMDFVSTPEGYKFLHDFFVNKKDDHKKLIHAKTEENPFIPKSYIENLKLNYTPQQIKAYLNGEFTNITSGIVYLSYERGKCETDKTAKQFDKLHIGVDFNIMNMSAVVHVIEGKIKYAVDEITKAYDTTELCDVIKERYPKNEITIYPDSSGQNRKTTGFSDVDILENSFNVSVSSKNPLIRDRVNAVNSEIRQGRYFINSSKCESLVECLEKQSYKNGIPDKTTDLDHLPDSVGYFITTHSTKPTEWQAPSIISM